MSSEWRALVGGPNASPTSEMQRLQREDKGFGSKCQDWGCLPGRHQWQGHRLS